MNSFEDQLWSHLSETHGADDAVASRTATRRRPRPAMLTAGVGGLAAAAVGVTLVFGASTSTPPAYALTQSPNGTITVTLNNISTGVPAVNADFAKLGIRMRAVPIEAGCTTPPTFGYDGPDNAPGLDGTSTTFTFSESQIPAGYTGFIAARDVSGQVQLSQGAMVNGTIPSCFPESVLHVVAPPAGSPAGTPDTMTTGTTPLPSSTNPLPSGATVTGPSQASTDPSQTSTSPS
jgi:hypothetical protein